MAAREHRVSRRALLGAACAVPAWPGLRAGLLSAVEGPLVRHPELDSGSIPPPARPSTRWTLKQVQGDEAWRRNLALLRHAEARLKALAHEPDEDLYDNANAVFFHALKKLVRTPAPDLPALALKIDLALRSS